VEDIRTGFTEEKEVIMATIATRDGVRAENVVVPLPDTDPHEARLSFDNGLERVTLGAGADSDALLTAEFGEPLPAVWVADWNVHVEYPLGSRLLRRNRSSSVQLNPDVPWALDVHGGTSKLDADLTGIDVRSVTLHSGAASPASTPRPRPSWLACAGRGWFARMRPACASMAARWRPLT
jgi:hypothetical protein